MKRTVAGRRKRIWQNLGVGTVIFVFSAMISFCVMLTMSFYKENRTVPGVYFERLALYLKLDEGLTGLLSCVTWTSLLTAFAVFVVVCIVGKMFISESINFFEILYKGRYIAAFALFFLYVAFELNGTSLYRWSVYFGGAEEYRPLFGTARAVRGDEWAAWSAFTMSQEYAGWPAVNRLIADGDISTVWISVGGIPAFNPAVIFKPLYWGFLLLGTDKGISILWVLRFILLFFVSFEFARVYTGNNRKLSFAAAMMITLAPYVQWWFSQSIAEVFIFGQGMLLCLHFYLGSDKRGSRMAAAAMLAYCLGCYVMIGYPSWLISTLYVLIPAAGVMIAQNRSCLGKKDILKFACPLAAVAAILAVIAFTSADTLSAVAGSVYPGERLETGGDALSRQDYYTGLYSLWLPFGKVDFSNHSELSCFITFAPAGVVMALLTMIREKKKDNLMIAMIAVEIFCAIFLVIGVSEFAAKITLLSNCRRIHTALGLADMILLVRGLSLKKEMPPAVAAVGAIWCTAVNMIFMLKWFEIAKIITAAVIVIYVTIFYLMFRIGSKNRLNERLLVFALACLMICAGGFVNPIQKGTQCVTQTDIVRYLSSAEDEPDALYAVEGFYPQTNIPLIAGKKCFTSTQVYPDVDRWKELDPNGEYEDVYNRFCHITFNITTEDTKFTLRHGDAITLDLSVEDMELVGIDYVMTHKVYDSYDGCRFEQVAEVDGWRIYKISYSQ
ncbi:MAG: hypothetical protein E7546_03235 [Ruminococcaceae bacterium]|nr:hypothetical protein [Oscillospiraceae bacterium]